MDNFAMNVQVEEMGYMPTDEIMSADEFLMLACGDIYEYSKNAKNSEVFQAIDEAWYSADEEVKRLAYNELYIRNIHEWRAYVRGFIMAVDAFNKK